MKYILDDKQKEYLGKIITSCIRRIEGFSRFKGTPADNLLNKMITIICDGSEEQKAYVNGFKDIVCMAKNMDKLLPQATLRDTDVHKSVYVLWMLNNGQNEILKLRLVDPERFKPRSEDESAHPEIITKSVNEYTQDCIQAHLKTMAKQSNVNKSDSSKTHEVEESKTNSPEKPTIGTYTAMANTSTISGLSNGRE